MLEGRKETVPLAFELAEALGEGAGSLHSLRGILGFVFRKVADGGRMGAQLELE